MTTSIGIGDESKRLAAMGLLSLCGLGLLGTALGIGVGIITGHWKYAALGGATLATGVGGIVVFGKDLPS